MRQQRQHVNKGGFDRHNHVRVELRESPNQRHVGRVAQTIDSRTILGAAYAGFECAGLDYTLCATWVKSAETSSPANPTPKLASIITAPDTTINPQEGSLPKTR